jgi:hypothetical protein
MSEGVEGSGLEQNTMRKTDGRTPCVCVKKPECPLGGAEAQAKGRG